MSLVAACLVAACNAVDATPDPSELPDAQPLPDAAPPEPDAPPTPPPPPPPPPETVVLVRYQGSPLPGVTVVFHDPTGMPLSMLTTDGQGRVASDVPDRAIVSVLSPVADGPELHTVHGIPKGATAVVSLRSRVPVSLGAFSFGVPDAYEWMTVAACPGGKAVTGNTNQEIGVGVYSDCLDAGGRLDLLITGAPLGDEPLVAAALPNAEFLASMELGMPNMQPLGLVNIGTFGSIWGPRDEEVGVTTEHAIVVGDARYVVHTDKERTIDHFGYADLAGTTASIGVEATAFREDATAWTSLIVVGPRTSIPSGVNLETDFLPFLDSPGGTGGANSGITYPQSAPRRPIATWVPLDTLRADIGRVTVVSFEGGTETHRWYATVPGTLDEVRAPLLPAQLMAYQPPQMGGWITEMTFEESDDLADYAAALGELVKPRVRQGRSRVTRYLANF
jgi:hypothetical protein